MKSDSASILLNLIVERSVNGLSPKNQLLLDELIASAPDPAQVTRELRQCESAVATQDFADMPVRLREMLCDRLQKSSDLMTNNHQSSLDDGIGPQDHEMPSSLRQAIIADGMAYVEKTYGTGMSVNGNYDSVHNLQGFAGEFRPRGVPVGRRNSLKAAASIACVAATRFGRLGVSVSRIPRVREVGTLIVAAAGLLALALFLRQQPEPVDRVEVARFSSMKDESSSLILMDEKSVNRHQRETFLTNPPVDMMRVACKTENGKRTVGELLWSDVQQKGFVSLSGLEVNDPNQFQYQVWIVDANQKYPVNGGVFDVADQKRAVVRLRPNMKIRRAAEFVVTQELPGGVVVSRRKNVVAVAKTKK